MEPKIQRLKASQARPGGVQRVSISPRFAASLRPMDWHQLLGQFSDAIDLIRTACTALETAEKTTFATPCLRFGLDKLDGAYQRLNATAIPTSEEDLDTPPTNARSAHAEVHRRRLSPTEATDNSRKRRAANKPKRARRG